MRLSNNRPRKNRFSPLEARKSKGELRIIFVSLFFIVLLTLAELHLSNISSEVSTLSNILIFALINVVLLLIILLVYLVCRNIARIVLERKRTPFGSRLRGKMVFAFVALSLIPTLLLFIVAASFINVSIKKWFNQQIVVALNESQDIALAYYRNTADTAVHFGRQISREVAARGFLGKSGPAGLGDFIGQARREYNAGVIDVISEQREVLAHSSARNVPAGYLGPEAGDISLGFTGQEISRIHHVGTMDLIRGIVPIMSREDPEKTIAVVVVTYYMPENLVAKMQLLSGTIERYLKLQPMKSPIRGGYILTLFLITMVIIFMAIWFGIYLANSLSRPIRELAEATGQVAEGNLDVFLEGEGDDEIGMLVASFNKMTEDLRNSQQAIREANEGLTRSNLELEQRRRYMEIVLRNVTAGVISVNRHGILTTINTSAERLLNISSEQVRGRHYREVLRSEQLEMVKDLLRNLLDSKKDSISRQVEIRLRDRTLTLLVNLSIMRDENGEFLGTVVVFDDLTQLLKAQRMAAWREVARRIAHEIKNPLTPIKLSAQRLRRKYLSCFGDDERAFDECTEMIIKSVDELKTLVDEFSNFARMPAAQPVPNNLNEVIREAVTLYQESHRTITFTFRADDSIPILLLDRDQIKRVLINLLDNAVAALDDDGSITIETSYNQELRMATFTVADTGHGIAPEDKPRLFEPYFSTKKAGTGLGLAIVNTIITDHHGFIRVKDNEPKGTKFIIELPVGGVYI